MFHSMFSGQGHHLGVGIGTDDATSRCAQDLHRNLTHESKSKHDADLPEAEVGLPESLQCDRPNRCEGSLLLTHAIWHWHAQIFGDPDDFCMARIASSSTGNLRPWLEIGTVCPHLQHGPRTAVTERL